MGFINIEQLVALRTTRGWDQKQLADAAGIDRSVISRLERGLQADCRVSILIAIASALETPAETLIRSHVRPPDNALSPELATAVMSLSQESSVVQRRIALIIRSFLEGLKL